MASFPQRPSSAARSSFSGALSPPATPKQAPPFSPPSSSPPTPSPPSHTHADASLFSPIQSGGSLLVAYQVRNKSVLVVGGGNVAAGRILSLLNADAHVHLVSPLSGCSPEVLHRIRTVPAPALVHYNTHYSPSLIQRINPILVLTAVDSPSVSSEIYQLCHSLRIPVNVADVPPECDFYFGSIHRDGPLQVMVSTNGNGPKLANIVRRQIAQGLPENLGEAITRVGVLRKRLRKIAGKHGDGTKRMEWMSRVCEEWTLEELCEMGEDEMVALLAGFREGRVITLREIRGEEDPPESTCAVTEDWASADEAEDDRSSSSEEDNSKREVFEEAFDGSFGFCF